MKHTGTLSRDVSSRPALRICCARRTVVGYCMTFVSYISLSFGRRQHCIVPASFCLLVAAALSSLS